MNSDIPGQLKTTPERQRVYMKPEEKMIRSAIFQEVQTFRQPFLWIIVLALACMAWWAGFQQLILKKPFGSKPTPDALMLLLWIVIGIALPLLILRARLITAVGSPGIFYRFIPFHRSWKWIPFKEIKSCQVHTFRPLLDYGGWGIRYGVTGKAYIVKGTRGILITFFNGRRLLFNSQKPEMMFRAISGFLKESSKETG
jgi:hypothetical protein